MVVVFEARVKAAAAAATKSEIKISAIRTCKHYKLYKLLHYNTERHFHSQ